MEKPKPGPEAYENDLSWVDRDDYADRYSPEHLAEIDEWVKSLEAPEPKRAKDFNPYHEPGGSPEGGRFASGPGGGGESGSETQVPEGHHRTMLAKARAVAVKHGYDPAKIINGPDKSPERDFTLNGKQYKAAGLAYIKDGSGKIKLFPTALSADTVEGVTVHEIMHHKWEAVNNAYLAEYKAVNALASPHSYKQNPVMGPDDTLKPPYDAQFPIYTRLREYIHGPVWLTMMDEDGCSSYSEEYWKQTSYQQAGSLGSAVHETLAELARLEHESIKDGKGSYIDRVIRLREGPWGKFYKAVNETYDELKREGKL